MITASHGQLGTVPCTMRSAIRYTEVTARGTTPSNPLAIVSSSVLNARFFTSPLFDTIELVLLERVSVIASQGPYPLTSHVTYWRLVSAPGNRAFKTKPNTNVKIASRRS